ncbi:MAG: rod shape-determining protein MreC [Amylibacter sp.]|nr:rod shape-determining protein MreC [Amylibacter sp.]
MAEQKSQDYNFGRSIRRVLFGLTLFFLFLTFLFWRIDNPRAEQMRVAILDKVIPNMEWAMEPITHISRIVDDFQSYGRIYEQNQELRRELQQMKAWREAAIQLEQEKARLLDLNNVKLPPKLSFISGVVMTDSGSPFRQSALINLGEHDGIVDGWAAMDGLGLLGRISGVGENSSRVIFLIDSNSRIPVVIKPSNQTAILSGDNTLLPVLDFIENPNLIQPGDRILTSGDGGVFPPDLLVGQAVLTSDNNFRTRLAADYKRLEFMRIIRHSPGLPISDPTRLIGPVLPFDNTTDQDVAADE